MEVTGQYVRRPADQTALMTFSASSFGGPIKSPSVSSILPMRLSTSRNAFTSPAGVAEFPSNGSWSGRIQGPQVSYPHVDQQSVPNTVVAHRFLHSGHSRSARSLPSGPGPSSVYTTNNVTHAAPVTVYPLGTVVIQPQTVDHRHLSTVSTAVGSNQRSYVSSPTKPKDLRKVLPVVAPHHILAYTFSFNFIFIFIQQSIQNLTLPMPNDRSCTPNIARRHHQLP